MKDLVAKINSEIETFKTESDLLIEKGIKDAGARARKSTFEIEKLLKEFRKVSIEEFRKYEKEEYVKNKLQAIIH